MQRAIIARQVFQDRMGDRAHSVAVFEAHNEEIRREVPAERLLVFSVSEGWEPLCGFLGVPVPDVPFPKTNSVAEFRKGTWVANPKH
jgi:hypothetical protein